MKKHSLLLLAVFSAIVNLSAQTGNVGINTTTPLAMLHVKDSSVLFQGATSLPGTPGNPPISSSGIRMMWYSDKAAFRAGYLNSSNSTKEKIGAYSFAAGYDPTARGEESIALGVDVIADSLICIAIGAAAKAYSVQDVSIGSFTVAQGGWSTAIGYEAKTTGRVTVAMGRSVVARAYNSVVVGCNNDSIGSSSLSSWVSTDPIFIIGNGSSSISRSNAMTVLKNARTGINTSTPLAMLHVENGDALFRGATILPGTPGNPPTSGQGIRMMWYQDKAAFRAGYVSSTQWDKDSIGDYSFATGESNKAKGKYAAAFGISNNVSGWGSAAM
ncbi:MAG TPA: hypothetical protein VN451_05005, partial [Chitinophagaceae bacterium]|nr:hypothetical protein [Chitinophagaceae bacterium]